MADRPTSQAAKSSLSSTAQNGDEELDSPPLRHLDPHQQQDFELVRCTSFVRLIRHESMAGGMCELTTIKQSKHPALSL